MTNSRPINFQDVPGNPYAALNLPADYGDLSPEGQRLARVNSVRLCNTPENAVRSWSRFVNYYLKPDEEGAFDPGFYKPPVHDSPPLHYKLVDWMHRYKRVAVGAPRECAKSTMRRSICLWKVVTVPRYDACGILAKDDFVVEDFYKYKTQLEGNERLLADFGALRPARGTGIWHNHLLTLSNGAILRGISIAGRSRGLRPDLVWLDDPEYDEDYISTNVAQNIEELKEKTLGVFLPMLSGPGVLVFTNTMIAQNSLGHHVVCTEDDPRFLDARKGGTWFKINIPAKDELGNCAWSAKYTTEFLAEREREMGGALFRREYMGQPGSGQDSPFIFDVSKHTFRVEPLEATAAPWLGDGQIHYMETAKGDDGIEYTPKTLGFREWLGPMKRVMAVDYAEGLSSSHDYSAIVVGAVDTRNNLFILDCWQGRVRSAGLAEQVWQMALKWRVNQIAIESVSTQMEVYRYIKQYGATHEIGKELDWLPSLIPLRYQGNISKSSRIMGLEWRFSQGRIKFLESLRDTRDGRELFQQIRNFTPDGKGLAHDDLIDTVSMLQYVMRAYTEQKLPAAGPPGILGRLEAGEQYYPGTQIPLLSGIDLRTLTLESLMKIMQHTERSKMDMYGNFVTNGPWDQEPAAIVDNPAFFGVEL